MNLFEASLARIWDHYKTKQFAVLTSWRQDCTQEDIEKNKEDSTFQKVSDVINGKYEEKTVPFKKVTVFQSMADGIATVVCGDDTK